MSATVAGTHRPVTPGLGTSRRPRAALLAALVAQLAAAGCATSPGPRPAAPPATPQAAGAPRPAPAAGPVRPRPAAGYAGLRDSLPPAGAAPLAGRRIVIDPGHGGYFKGCIGVNGLTEAEVNLGVALALDSLLRAQGAAVLLTRDRDRDFLTPADSTLKTDLAERVRLATAFDPDLFVSIHHNADPGGAHDVNETQTYYKLGDEGPSYDAATDVHRALVRNVGIAAQKLLPGNFAVVRGQGAPALLTESSYLTDPDVEARLRTPEARREEAAALDLGIARFFARRAPVIEWFARVEDEGPAPASGEGFPVLAARVSGAFDDVQLIVDGAPQVPQRVRDSLWWTPSAPLASGGHSATLRVRLAAEGSARPRTLEFRLAKSFRRIDASFPGQRSWNGSQPLALRVRVYDQDGLALRDTVHVRVRPRPGVALPADTVLTVADGEAWGYFRPGAAARARRTATLEFRVRPVARIVDIARRTLAPEIVAALPWRRAARPACRTDFVRLMPAGARLAGAPGTNPGGSASAWLDRNGFAILVADSAGNAHVPAIRGFRAWGPDTAWPPRVVAIAGGALVGRRIVLDPEGGGEDAAGMGPSGTRAATLNLDVARALAGMLEAAGADVRLTRSSDASVSELERVQVSEGFRADRFLRIAHEPAPPVAGHYFSSGAGRRWGQAVARECAALGLADSLPVTEISRYALTQVSCTALYASLARVDSAADEARLLAPGALRAEAYALFAALAHDFAPGAAWPADSLRVTDAGGAPLAGAVITLGGALVLQAGPGGTVRFERTEPGPVEVASADPRAKFREVLLESEHGRTFSGPR